MSVKTKNHRATKWLGILVECNPTGVHQSFADAKAGNPFFRRNKCLLFRELGEDIVGHQLHERYNHQKA